MKNTEKFIGSIGDINALGVGATFVVQDESGDYSAINFDCWRLNVGEEQWQDEYSGDMTWDIYQFDIDQLTMDANGDLIRNGNYVPWFNSHLESIASCVGVEVQELKETFCNDDPMVRIWGYDAIASHSGYNNLDCYPNNYDLANIKECYGHLNNLGKSIDLRYRRKGA